MDTPKHTDFQTPPDISELMVSMLPKDISEILEPTPGIGNLVSAANNAGHKVFAPHRFEHVDPKSRFDAIVMNPPFTPMNTGYEILYKCMEMSDRIVALMPWLTVINSSKRTKIIMDFGLISITHLNRNVFPGSRVQCCILNMSKGYSGETFFKYHA